MTNDTSRAAIIDAIAGRRSVRAFLPDPVPDETVRDILHAASRAPSGTNMQPWRVDVVTGESLARLTDAVGAAFNDPDYRRDQPYNYYPDTFPEPFLARRRKVGWDMYGLLGIERGEKDKMHAQHGRNFTFFDAPVGLIFSIHNRLEIGSWLDYGMFLQNVMVAARGRGLDTCPQAAFASVHEGIRPVLDIPEGEVVVCGMALGHADEAAVENALETERAALDEFATFHE